MEQSTKSKGTPVQPGMVDGHSVMIGTGSSSIDRQGVCVDQQIGMNPKPKWGLPDLEY